MISHERAECLKGVQYFENLAVLIFKVHCASRLLAMKIHSLDQLCKGLAKFRNISFLNRMFEFLEIDGAFKQVW